jgi:uncharacterized membrane-anchored protein YhcB (DUF1043 family)
MDDLSMFMWRCAVVAFIGGAVIGFVIGYKL